MDCRPRRYAARRRADARHHAAPHPDRAHLGRSGGRRPLRGRFRRTVLIDWRAAIGGRGPRRSRIHSCREGVAGNQRRQMETDGPMTDDVTKPINADSRIKPWRTRTGRNITSRALNATAESSAAARCVAIDTSDEGGRRAIPVPITNLAALGRFSPSVSDRLAQRARQKLNRIRLLDKFKACMGVFG